MPTSALTPEEFQRIARALAEPTRYELLRRIYACKSVTCGCAVGELPISPATASHHLRELELAGLVHVTKEGRFRRLTARREVWRAYLAHLRQL